MAIDPKKTVTSSEMKSLDNKAITVYGISGLVLMENAGRAIADVVQKIVAEKHRGEDVLLQRVLVVAGTGNNGGDGFVAARHLHNRGLNVKVLLVGEISKLKGDALNNWGIISTMNINSYQVNHISTEQCLALLAGCDCIIDALIGIGLQDKVSGIPERIITYINERDVPVIAADVPSGIDADTGEVHGIAVKAHTTVTMGAVKCGLLNEVARAYVGDLIVADISLPRELLE
ncbi:MAG: NAD(P)H-hydrate epimerase [Candidatus Omnitrophica bacterium]|nr:NAD(P)H-hydrate epimerase [Candidatus Omnitrophota bacterium]